MSIHPLLPNSQPRPSSPARAKRALALGFLSLLLPSIAARAQTTTPACGPGVREIFDFHVGDIFQYRIYSQAAQGMGHYAEVIRKYKVVSRNESGFIRTYDFSGWESHSSLLESTLLEKSFNSYQGTGTYLDTAHSPFNGCPGEIVTMTNEPGLDTRVEAFQGDTSVFPLARPGLRMKAFGRVLGRRRDTTLVPIPDAGGEAETFAEGLGLVSASHGGLGPFSHTYLVGYVKGRDTVGVVSPDSSFWHTTALPSPAARRTGSAILSADAGGVISAYDAQGRQLPAIEKRLSPTATTPRFRK
jgi:hypothetical protein